MYPDAHRLVMCGCHESGWFLIRDLLADGFRFAHFVTLTPAQGARYQVAGYRDFTDLAAQYGIPVYHPVSYALTDPADQAFFERQGFDLLIQGGWQRLFPEAVLRTLRVGAVGVHGSADELPKGRGRSPLNWSLIEGRRRFLMQLFLITPGVDDGDVVDVEDFDITPFDTIRTLYYKNAIVTRRMQRRTIPRLLDGTAERHPQRGVPSHYPRRTADDGRIDWEEMDVWAVHDFIRAQTRPYPGAFAALDGGLRTLWRAQVFDTRIRYPEAAYGDVVERFGHDLVVKCRGGLLLIDDHEPRFP